LTREQIADLTKHRALLKELMQVAYQKRVT